jgi:hypothetical protein
MINYKSTGKLVYSPRSHLGEPSKWLVLMCDDEISNYYRNLYARQYPYLNGDKSGKLTRPIFGSHVSIIRGEKLPKPELWGLYANKIIEFEYEPGVKDNNIYYWLSVKCPYLLDLRAKFGLNPNPRFGLHMTIGISTNT